MAKRLGYGDSFINAVENNLGRQQGVGFLDIANSPKSAFETGMRLQIGDLQQSGKWDKMSVAQQNKAIRRIAKRLQKVLPKAGYIGDMSLSTFGIEPKGTPKNTRRTLPENTPKKRISPAEQEYLKSEAQTIQTGEEAKPTKAGKKAAKKAEAERRAEEKAAKEEEADAKRKTKANNKTPFQQGMEQGKQAGKNVSQKAQDVSDATKRAAQDVSDATKRVAKRAVEEVADTTARNTGRLMGLAKGLGPPVIKAAGPVGAALGAVVDTVQMSDPENRAQAQKDIETPNTEGILQDRKIPFTDIGFSPKAALDATTGGVRQIFYDDATSPVELIVGGVRSLAERAKEGEQPALDEKMMYSGAGESMHNTVPAPPLDPSSGFFTKEESAAIFKDVQDKIAQEKADKAERAARAKRDNITPAEMRSILGTSPKPTETSTSTSLSSMLSAPEQTDKPTTVSAPVEQTDKPTSTDNIDLSVLEEVVEAADEGEKDAPEPSAELIQFRDNLKKEAAARKESLGKPLPTPSTGPNTDTAPSTDYIEIASGKLFNDTHGTDFNPKSDTDKRKLGEMVQKLERDGGLGKKGNEQFAIEYYREFDYV